MSTTKRRAKYLLAFVAAAVLALAMAVPAFAEGAGQITIKSSENGTTYNFYQMLSLTGTDNSNPADNDFADAGDAVAYTLATDSKWVGFFTGTGAGASYMVAAADATAEQKASAGIVNYNGSTYYLTLTEQNIVAFTNAAMDYVMKANPAIPISATKSGTGSDVTVSNLDLGYYLMIPVNASIKNTNSSGSVASLTSTLPIAEIKVKAEKPSITKKDDAISADVGQKITYTIEGTMPNTAGYDMYKYIITDEMTSGLTFNKDVKVMLGTEDITKQVTIDYTTANKFSADIPVKSLQGTDGANVGKKITLTYSAIVNDNAVATSQEKNKAQLEYGHKPGETDKTTPIEEEVYSAKVIINKYTGDKSTGTKLANAKFALMNSEGKYYKYTAATSTEPAKVEWVTVTGAPTSGTANVTDAQAKALADAAAQTTSPYTAATTNNLGAAEFPGIKDGTYYLVEFAAPDGYNRLDTPKEVKVEGTNVDTQQTENVAQAGQSSFDAAQNATADVENNSGSVLPSTGGIGTTILYIIGGILVLGAVVFLITKRRMAKVNIESDDTI